MGSIYVSVWREVLDVCSNEADVSSCMWRLAVIGDLNKPHSGKVVNNKISDSPSHKEKRLVSLPVPRKYYLSNDLWGLV